MIVLALLLIAAGAVIFVLGLFTTDLEGEGRLEFLGMEIGAVDLFILGAVSGAAVLWGLWILKFGTKRSLTIRKERKQLAELNEKLERVDNDRRQELEES